MIGVIGAICAAGILLFHILNLARFKRQAFNQFDLIQRLAKQNRVLSSLYSWFVLATRLLLIGALVYFLAKYSKEEESAGAAVVVLPDMPYYSRANLQVLDSLAHRVNKSGRNPSRIITSNVSIKELFPSFTYAANFHAIKKAFIDSGAFQADSIRLSSGSNQSLRMASDTSINLSHDGPAPLQATLNGRSINGNSLGRPISLNTSTISELEVVDNEARQYYFLNATDKPTVSVANDAILKNAIDRSILNVVSDPSKAGLWVGLNAFSSKVESKSILYAPPSESGALADFSRMGVSIKLKPQTASADTFDLIDRSYFNYALVSGSSTNVPSLYGKPIYDISGYFIPLIHNDKNQVLAALLPNTQGNSIIFINAKMGKSGTNLFESELFLPLLYSLTKRATQIKKVVSYDLCDKKSQAALNELTVNADSLFYRQGFAKPYYIGKKVEHLSMPGIYTVFNGSDSSQVAVNQLHCKGDLPLFAYSFEEKRGVKSQQAGMWLMLSMALFALVEGVALTNRLRSKR